MGLARTGPWPNFNAPIPLKGHNAPRVAAGSRLRITAPVMKKIIAAAALLLAFAAPRAQAQTAPATNPDGTLAAPALITPEQQQQRADEAKRSYEAQRETTKNNEQAMRDSKNAIGDQRNREKDLKKEARAARDAKNQQKDQLKAQRKQTKEAAEREKMAKQQMKEERKRAKEMK